MKDLTQIPLGSYCYDIKEITVNGTIKIKTIPCPFWELRKDKPEQENGYCHFLKSGDWESEESSLLWDGVKECGINDDLVSGDSDN